MSFSPTFYSTDVPGNHPGLPMFNAIQSVTVKDPDMDPVEKAKLEEALTKHLRNLNPTVVRHISTGPVSFSGKGVPFVRPQLDHMLPLAVALGLEKEEGWREAWRKMAREREDLCKLVRTVLEWNHEEGTDGNTFEYCFCTKYLPQVITSVLNEPQPSIFSSPFDLILHGAASTPLLSYYLSLHPDLAIKLRNAYYQKALDGFRLNVGENDCYSHFYPHLGVIRVCVEAYTFSPHATPSQRTLSLPPFEPVAESNVLAVARRLQSLITLSPKKPWEDRFALSFLVFSHAIPEEGDIRVKYPDFQDSMSATGWEFCGEQTCRVREAAKMKACSRCRVTRYCSTDHQAKDWIRHKPFCQKLLWDA